MIDLIKPYEPHWKTEFEKIKTVLESALQNIDVDIQHVGSTAIPGLPAKPILDIDIIIGDKKALDEVSSRLEKLGYINKGEQGIAGRFAFRQGSEFIPANWPAHHLYVCFSDSLALKNHILFRDALWQDQKLVEKYSSLKMALVNEKGMTREEYQKRKTEFIISVLKDLGLETDELNQITNENV
ncbi:MAG TPA: GrpB family protein [Chitinophagaceae bacterium]|nr:GrpB family protein [Chitinophagaceae bacterium]